MTLGVQQTSSEPARSTPADDLAIRRRVKELVSAGAFHEVAEMLETALASDPENQLLLIMLGNNYAQLDRDEDAVGCFARAQAVAPDSPAVLGRLGRLYAKLGRNREAVPVLTQALMLEPDNAVHLRGLTHALKKAATAEEAVDVFRKLFASFPENDDIALALAKFLELARDYEAAVEILERVRARSSDNRSCLIQLGALYTKPRSPDRAIELFETALRERPDDLPTIRELALAHWTKGDLAKAASLLEQVRDARPNSVSALKDLGRLYAARGNRARASEMNALASDAAARMETVQRGITSSPAFPSRWHLVDECLRLANPDGLVLEFGVATGTSLRYVAKALGTDVYGFDSFEGLPEAWESRAGQGAFLQAKLPEVPPNAHLVAGWFNETLPGFLAEHQGNVRFLHIDCDLYVSTKIVFDLLADRLTTGTVILFDELWGYTGWENHEWRALCELVEQTGMTFAFVGHVTKAAQVAIRITGMGRDREPEVGDAPASRFGAGRWRVGKRQRRRGS